MPDYGPYTAEQKCLEIDARSQGGVIPVIWQDGEISKVAIVKFETDGGTVTRCFQCEEPVFTGRIQEYLLHLKHPKRLRFGSSQTRLTGRLEWRTYPDLAGCNCRTA